MVQCQRFEPLVIPIKFHRALRQPSVVVRRFSWGGGGAWQAAQALERETVAHHQELTQLHLRLNELEVSRERLAEQRKQQQRWEW